MGRMSKGSGEGVEVRRGDALISVQVFGTSWSRVVDLYIGGCSPLSNRNSLPPPTLS